MPRLRRWCGAAEKVPAMRRRQQNQLQLQISCGEKRAAQPEEWLCHEN
jgi:hypothetical protein